ncbi:MAG: hydantoinase/oxoprolinase family protein [Proteobacteria bacterium]|nr:hydantoinase/oxoprolinase family protein [Pseudomonadota bacterium]
MRVGVEVGGTFTDLVAIDGDGVRIAKVPSVPARPDEGVFAALEAGAIALNDIEELVHGSTVATNAVLERKGRPTAFLVTAGFRDILFLQRQSRTRIYDLAYAKPKPLVDRRDCIEIEERVDANGDVITPLDPERAAHQLARSLAERPYEAVAICLLNSYVNPAHETALARLVRRDFPGLTVTCSSDVSREFREFERASTTTLAAYIQPVVDGYLSRIEERLGQQQFQGRFSVMQSNGGRLPPEAMRRNPVTALFSGPAAGVVGAVKQAGLSGHSDLISLDMGGTSTDVCLIADGNPEIAGETEIGGLPVRTPMLDIVTVGAGGGSNVWVDDGGMLRVGPMSSGADPGPACYGRGGTAPTITDAHVIRGSIQPHAFLGGKMTIDAERSHRVFEPLARRFGMSVEAIADSAIRVADSNVVRAIQLISTERGRDPRDYMLVPFGGAGPLHAARIAEELGVRSILVPPNAGVLSAYGLLAADYVRYAAETRRIPVDGTAPEKVRATFEEIKQRETQALAELGIDGRRVHGYALGMRYVGQAYEVMVDFDADTLQHLDTKDLIERFVQCHRKVFLHGETGSQRVEIVYFRLSTTVPTAALPRFVEDGAFDLPAADAEIFEAGERKRYRLVTRLSLAPGTSLDGPALIEESTSTVLLPPRWRAEIDANNNLLMQRNSDE